MASTLSSVRHAVAPFARWAGLYTGVYAALRRLRPSRSIAILRYHAIVAPRDCWYAAPGVCVSPQAFEAHVAHLSAHYAVRSLPDVVDALKTGTPLPHNVAVFTFDDGYADNLLAAGILAKYGVSGTFYITAGCLRGDGAFWPSEVRIHAQALVGQMITLAADGHRLEVDNRSPGGMEAAARALARLFKTQPGAVRDDLLAQLRRLSGIASPPSPMLSWDELRRLRALGMTIGAHTLSHANLPSAGRQGAQDEIVSSRNRLEAGLETAITMFSYPNGGAEVYYTPEIQDMVRQAGFHAATTSRNGFATRQSDLYALERVKVSERLADLLFALEVERFAFRPTPGPRAADLVVE